MLNLVQELFNDARALYAPEMGRTVILILSLLLIRFIVGRLVQSQRNMPPEDRRKLLISLRNTLFIFGIAGVGLIWATELQALAVSMLAFAAALILATKELIMCLAGGVIRRASKSYDVGDTIQMGALRGRVIDIGLMSTTLMEIAAPHMGHQMTGRVYQFPNSQLLSQAIVNENYLGEYVVHTMTMHIPYTVAPERAERIVLKAAQEFTLPFKDIVEQHFERLERRHLLDVPSTEPRVSFQLMSDLEYILSLRIALPMKERQRVEQSILKIFLFECFPEHAVNNEISTPRVSNHHEH